MKPLSFSECEFLEEHLKILEGALLRDILSSKTDILCSFRVSGKTLWLWVDLKASSPFLCLEEKLSLDIKKRNQPLVLFLKAHFVGKRLQSLRLCKEKGRLFLFSFDESFIWEIRLFPGHQNFIASVGEKALSWHKVKELGVLGGRKISDNPRSLEVLKKEWLEDRQKVFKDKKIYLSLERKIEKKEKALLQVQKRLQEGGDEKKWLDWAKWLKERAYLSWKDVEIPHLWKKWAQTSENLTWNMERAFAKAKSFKGKNKRAYLRYEELKKELEILKVSSPEGDEAKKSQRDLFKESGSKGRRKNLSASLSCYVGKSAQDNLSLLRKARPWDYWLHMKDEPSAHGIIHRNKGEKVSQKEFQQACTFLLEHTFKGKRGEGERFHFIIAEVRYVRPIKGDRVGRVRYQKEKIVTITVG